MTSDSPKRWLAMFLGACMMLPAQADDRIMADKTAIQAAFLYNFALFTEWPNLPDNAFTFCVIADDHMLDALASIKTKLMKNRPIVIQKIEAPKQARNCQILFVGNSEHRLMKDIAGQINTDPVLVVAEEDSVDLRQAIILLSEQQNRIGFKINRTEASKRSITFSSKLLKLAVQIY